MLGWLFSRVSRCAMLVLGALAVAGCQANFPGGGSRAVSPDRAVPVAILLPYGSANAGDSVVAQALEDAARLAIGDLAGVRLDLRVYETAGDAAIGAAAATRAVDDGAKVILGPLYADVAAAVGVAVANDNVSVLSFSNNTSVAGGNVYVLGNTFENTADRVISYATAQGRNRVAVLHANDTAGNIARAAVQSAVGKSGATLVAAIPYELSQEGVFNAVPIVRDAVREAGANSVFFTSAYSGALPIFAQLLPENGIQPGDVQFMGLARWDVPSEALSLAGLQGGWFALPDQGLSAQFDSRFQAAFARAPHPLAGLAFDGISAIGAVVRDAGEIGPASLTQPSGFAGVNGVFRLRADGTNERALAIAQIIDGQVQVISPAPRRFGTPGL
ncbi:penicillin-binding protein activator [Thalassobacter stenotrophicus]|uniref:Amino acid/amide ABC transporter substrate-binding protein, HAAT family n=2 Tax=Thalassobacter stenotrophicus TaxID=266809 RepID=A0ABY1I1Y6_9RHOB|nr:penicillin-binding protein activator [Thalassobacter stenotrophicus]CUH61683.1 Putative lipoprotein [Thalassobacter stenotrophicus]SHI44743.1 amino acid/amide ABC transporter substrate-binding protein, HAAT family [Thalassobacter stenotrophicus DSM 16310]